MSRDEDAIRIAVSHHCLFKIAHYEVGGETSLSSEKIQGIPLALSILITIVYC